jgi:hypothetical protein
MKFSLPRRTMAFVLLLVLSFGGTVRSDVAVPGNVLDPKTAAEAWNVIRLATKNVDQLLDENRLPEIPNQISFCSPSLRALARIPDTPEVRTKIGELTKRAFISVNAIAVGAQRNNPVGVKAALDSLRAILDSIASHFDPKTVKADIFFCPMHPDFVSENSKTPCAKCGMSLLPRRIPYSFIYTKPGAPTVRMTATTSGPIEAGKKVDVTVHMAKADKSPVLHEDLLVLHTQPIHLLIEESGLGDYHHEHPLPTKTPGDFAFSFTPTKTVPYRIWADIVPVSTGVQELPFVDLPSTGKAGPPADMENRFNSTAGGYNFALTLSGGNVIPAKAQQARQMAITVTDADGKSVTRLEPVMNAFAHLVGFYSDYNTVVHLHPTGGDILNPALRGGPALGFILFPPKAGFVRLYCQVMIDGKMVFAPFNLNIQP